MTPSSPKNRPKGTYTGPLRDAGSQDIPTFFCRSEAPHVPLVRPFMDMETGDSFEHTEVAAHPKAMENIQLRSAYADFVAAKNRNLTTREALATLSQHTVCPLTCESMQEPVRAPDNMLYEADSLIKSVRTWKAVSPTTREPFPPQLSLTVDRRMQQLSMACGTDIPPQRLVTTRHQVTARRYAPTLEAAEEGRLHEIAPCRHSGIVNNVVFLAESAVAGAAMHAFGVSESLCLMGACIFFAGARLLPINLHPTAGWLTRAAPPPP